ncbi:MAG: DUF3592 domain-containing protein [Spirochaetota bacterium]
MKRRDFLSLSFRVVGIVFVGIGAFVAVSSGVFVSRAEQVAGTVVDYAVEQNEITFLRSGEPTGILYYPVIEYSAGGETYAVRGRSGTTDRPYDTGARVDLLVSAANPANARIDSAFGVWGSAIILGGLGGLFLLLSVLAPFGFGGTRRG